MRLIFLICLLCTLSTADALTIELTTTGPVSTLDSARDAARKARADGDHRPITVRIGDGVYPITAPTLFDFRDNGVTYEAAVGARPLFMGGRKLAGFKAGADGVWTTTIPEVRDNQWYFEALWVNGRRAIRARVPKEDSIQAVAQPTEPLPGIALTADAGHTLLQVAPKDVEIFRGMSAAELHDVNVLAYHTWEVNRHRIAGVRIEDGTLQFTGGGSYPFFKPDPIQRLHYENFRAAMTAPGEWFLARDGTLSYIPRPGEQIETAQVVAPVAPQWMIFKGDTSGQPAVSDIHFKGLAFQFQSYLLPEAGTHFGQAEKDAGAAVEADGASGLTFENCEFAHTLANAAWFRRGCRDITIRDCWIHDLGAGGVKIGDPKVADSGPAQSSHIAIENCIIHSGGRYFIGAIGVTIFHASDCAIRHCDIADFFYTAVSIGWTWGYHPTACARNLVEHCHLHHLGWAVLSDMGGVYTLGPQPGTTIRGCHIHDIGVATYGGWGMYNDEGSTGVLWENNLVHDTQDAGYHMHYGRDDVVRNNIIANCAEAHLRRSRPEDHFAFTFERNIVLLGAGTLFAPTNANWLDGHVDLHNNVYWKPAGQIENFAGKSWAQWQALGCDRGSIVADPCFVDPTRSDWTLPPDSPAVRVGFIPFDWKVAGVTGDETWRRLAAPSFPPMKYGTELKPPPLSLHDGFESTALGGKPLMAWQGVAPSDAIAVVSDRPSKGKHCLQLTDGPDIEPAYDPHFFYSPHHERGTTRVAFDVRAEPEYRLALEWRDKSSPYRTGPAILVEHNTISAGDQKLADISPDVWTHIEMIAGLGPVSDGAWTCTISTPGKEPLRFTGLKFVDPTMKSLEWLGFSSPGKERARCWLDEIEIENTPTSIK